MVREEGVGLVVGHVVCEVVTGGAHQDREEGDPDQQRVQDVIRANRQALPFGLERVAGVLSPR